MRKLREKLSGRRGETMVEVLIAILLIYTAVLMSFESIRASSNLVNTSEKQTDVEYYQGLSKAERQDSGSADATGTLTIKSIGMSDQSVPIHVYGGSGMYSYSKN